LTYDMHFGAEDSCKSRETSAYWAYWGSGPSGW